MIEAPERPVEPRETAPEIYTHEYYRRIFTLESRHWWHSGMREIAARLLKPYLPGNPKSKIQNPEFSILDAGCGTGLTMSWAKELVPNAEVVGIDISPHALRFCREERGLETIQGSVMDLPFEDESFDLALCWDVIQHLPTDGGDVIALREMRRVLRPGGLALIRANSRQGMGHTEEEKDHDFQRYTLPEVVKRMEEAGFEALRATYANGLPAVYDTLRRKVRRVRSAKQTGRVYEGFGVRDTSAQAPRLNAILKHVIGAEARYLSGSNRSLPFGHSTLVLGRRK